MVHCEVKSPVLGCAALQFTYHIHVLHVQNITKKQQMYNEVQCKKWSGTLLRERKDMHQNTM